MVDDNIRDTILKENKDVSKPIKRKVTIFKDEE